MGMMTRFLLIFLLAMPALAQLGPASFTNGNMLWLDGLAGNDSTAIKYRADKAFKTGTAVKNAATAGDTIFVRPPNLTLTNFLARGVYYQIFAQRITQPPEFPNGIGLFDDRATGATTNVINAEFADIVYDNVGIVTPKTINNALGVFTITNANTALTFKGNRGYFGDNYGENPLSNAFLHVKNAAFVDFDINSVEAPSLDFSYHGLALFFEKASYAKIRIDRIISDHDWCVVLKEPAGGVVSYLDLSCSYMFSQGEGAIYINGNSSTWTNRIRLGSVNSGNVSIMVITGGRNFITADSIHNFAGTGSAFDISGGINEITVSRLSTDVNGGYFTISGGYNVIKVSEYRMLTGGALSVPGVIITGGTNVFDGGDLVVTNTHGFKLSGSHSTTLKDMFIRVADAGTGDTNWCIQNLTNGLVLQNVSLQAPSTNRFSIWSTNANNHLTIRGILHNSGWTNSLTTVTQGVYKIVGGTSRL